MRNYETKILKTLEKLLRFKLKCPVLTGSHLIFCRQFPAHIDSKFGVCIANTNLTDIYWQLFNIRSQFFAGMHKKRIE